MLLQVMCVVIPLSLCAIPLIYYHRTSVMETVLSVNYQELYTLCKTKVCAAIHFYPIHYIKYYTHIHLTII